MNDKEFEEKVDELDQQFKKWEAGSKEQDAKLVEKEYPDPSYTNHSLLHDDIKEMAELEEENERLMKDLDMKEDFDNSDFKKMKDQLLHPIPRSFNRYPESKISRRKKRNETPESKISRRKKRNETIAAVILGMLLVPIVLTALYFYPGPSPYQQLPKFSLTVTDGITSEKLYTDHFRYKLYGVNGDPYDFNGFVFLESDELDDLERVDFDDYGYEFYIIEYNGTNEEGTKIYYTRWARILPDTSNDLISFALPSSSRMNVMFMNLTSVNPAKGTGENITIIVGTNQSESGCGYVPMFDYSREEETNVEIKVVFMNPIGMIDFRVRNDKNYNMQRYKINSTCMAFIIYDLLATLTTYYGYWYVSGNSIIDMQLMYGPTVLCSW
jgi:hypothetical protein